MRLVATEYVSLDMFADEPGVWSGEWFNDEAGQFKFEELMAADALLIGKNTYQGFAAAWPQFDDPQGFATKMNSMPKYVVSSTLDSVEWSGAELLGPDLVAEINRLKAQDGGDLLLSGSPQLFQALHDEGLIDVYRFLLFPILLAGSLPLYGSSGTRRTLRLASSKIFATGVIAAEYLPAQS
jgi:dihydrofolate reductase